MVASRELLHAGFMLADVAVAASPRSLETERLRLRAWRDDDADGYVALHGDPRVAYWLGGRMTPEQALASMDQLRRRLAELGWGMWAVERKEDEVLLGVCGLQPIADDVPLPAGVEASWRLSTAAWGRGYCTEAMQAVLADADTRGQQEILSFTAASNSRSQAVMTRLGFERDPASDFEHPRLPPGHSLRPHVVYRRRRPGHAS